MSKKTKKYRTADRALTPEQVKLLIQEGEGLTVEFKERYTSRTDEDIVAFANARGERCCLECATTGASSANA